MDALLVSKVARDEYLGMFSELGLSLTALNVSGNPLHPDPEVRSKHSRDLLDTIRLAGLLGVVNVVAMAGQPSSSTSDPYPAWITSFPWDSAYSEVLDYQWNEIAIPFWKRVDLLAGEAGVRICVEMHPHMLVYNPPTLERLLNETGAQWIGCEMDPSHLFWQGIDPIATIHQFRERIFNAAAKDTRINQDNVRLNGVLHNGWRPLEPKFSIGGRYLLNRRPVDPPWEFVAPGRAHDVAFWSEFLSALQHYTPDISVNIENEDEELGSIDGTTYAANTLKLALAATGDSASMSAN
jgi:sugar phosphate isomerase/epimerase